MEWIYALIQLYIGQLILISRNLQMKPKSIVEKNHFDKYA